MRDDSQLHDADSTDTILLDKVLNKNVKKDDEEKEENSAMSGCSSILLMSEE